MLVTAAQLLLGILLLAYASDWLTEGCARAARRFGISKFVVGALIIGFGTSSPELFTSVYASLRGSGGIAVGNAVGSNLTNISLILGLAVLLFPATTGRVELRNAVLCACVTLLAWVVLGGGSVSRAEGALLVLVFLAYLMYSVRNHQGVEKQEEKGRIALPTLAGLAGVLLGSVMLVDSAAELARAFGVPESVIGLTLVAFGTSLPELAVSIVAARKGY
ncbi:MAG: sodium:calcium antiporter, partial [Euryarchaeota archaeon]|nr:sodium:calcium antiporter [Euryarchaeota archaeon]